MNILSFFKYIFSLSWITWIVIILVNINTIYNITLIQLILIFWFILQPYLTWRRSNSSNFKEYILFFQNFEQNSTRNINICRSTGAVSIHDYLKEKSTKNIFLSIVVPAYFEENRIPTMLEQTLSYLTSKFDKSSEIIVVNDASKDKTTEQSMEFVTFQGKQIDLKVVEYQKNKGKGGAVKIGMMIARGEYALMVDADGATQFSDIEKLLEKMKKIMNKKDQGFVAGSRKINDEDVERTFIRSITAWFSQFIITVIVGIKIKDTQCGFKLFSRNCYKKIFPIQHLERWAFDVELFYLCKCFGIPCVEVPVVWREIDGSKLNVVSASITMARDFVLIKVFYLLRLWRTTDQYKIPHPPK